MPRTVAARRNLIPSTLRPASMPRNPPLMLCTLVKDFGEGSDWIFEPKLDGLRALATVDRGSRVELISRNDKPQNAIFPEIVDGLKRCAKQPVMLDGEIVCLDANGQASFRLLQQRFHVTDAKRLLERLRRLPTQFFVFDILYFDRYDLRSLPLEQRKRILHHAIAWREPIREIEFITRRGKQFFQRTCKSGGEGIIAKRVDSPYTGDRSDAWLKIKCSGRQEFVIGGFTDPQRSRVGLGALLVGYYDDDGKIFRYAGKVGTGFDNEMLQDLRSRLEKLQIDRSPFSDDAAPSGEFVHYVRPKLVAEIEYAEWTQNDLLRQPRFEGLREDKPATAVRRERPKV
jgi:DNA ligase D-like protein (predicted ligase)